MKDNDKKLFEKVDETTKAVRVMEERLMTMEKTLKMWHAVQEVNGQNIQETNQQVKLLDSLLQKRITNHQDQVKMQHEE